MPDVAALPAGALTWADIAAPSAARAGARSAVLGRLWGAFAREPMPGMGPRVRLGSSLTVSIRGHRLTGPAAAADPFAPQPVSLDLDGRDVADPAEVIRAFDLGPFTERLAVEVANSVDNLTLARSAQAAPDGGASMLARAAADPDPLAYLEQSVVDGHPLHPGCRTRMGLSPAEVLRYAPEHRALVTLREVRVPPRRWIGVNAPPVLIVHPWQFEHVLAAHPFLTPAGTSTARPLMSLRTLALVAEPASHVKTAIDVQMTSAVRIVSPAAIHNGPILSRLLTQVAPAGFGVMAEIATGAVLIDGEASRSLAMVRRRVPSLPAGALAVPFGVLAAPSAATGRPIVTELVDDPIAFLGEVASLVLRPAMHLLRIGIALEAHGQNLLLVVHDGRPTGVLYRDLGGVRVSPARLRAAGVEAPPLRGDLVTDDPYALRTKLFASAVSTVLGELVAVLGRESGAEPDASWRAVAGAARASGGARDDIEALLTAALPLKATTAMRLRADPLEDVWVDRPNPMAAHA